MPKARDAASLIIINIRIVASAGDVRQKVERPGDVVAMSRSAARVA